MKLTKRIAFIIIVPLFIVPFLLGNAFAQKGPFKMKVAYFQGTQRFPLYVMDKLNLWKKYHIDVERVEVQSVAVLYTLMTGKKVDISFSGWSAAALFRTRGVDLLVVHPVSINNNEVIVHADSDIRSFSDLKGKKIGNYAGPAGASTAELKTIARDFYNIDLDKEAKFNYGAPAALAALLEKRELDASLTMDPWTARFLMSGKYRSIARLDNECVKRGIFPILLVTVVTNEEYANKNPEAITNFIKTYREAVNYMKTNDEIWVELANSVGIETKEGVKLIKERLGYLFITEWDDKVINAHREFAKREIQVMGPEYLPYFPDGVLTTKFLPKD